METMKIGDRNYNVIKQVKVKDSDQTIPLVDIPMMSDETWIRKSRENAVHNYRREFGKEPESVEQAVEWQDRRVRERIGGCGK